jgi:hypothetical protein
MHDRPTRPFNTTGPHAPLTRLMRCSASDAILIMLLSSSCDFDSKTRKDTSPCYPHHAIIIILWFRQQDSERYIAMLSSSCSHSYHHLVISTERVGEIHLHAIIILLLRQDTRLPIPNEYFGRRNKRWDADLWSTFQWSVARMAELTNHALYFDRHIVMLSSSSELYWKQRHSLSCVGFTRVTRHNIWCFWLATVKLRSRVRNVGLTFQNFKRTHKRMPNLKVVA